MLLNVVQVNSALFSHYPSAKRLVAELSDIQVKQFQQLYNDACDVGLGLRNPKTGNVTRWYLSESETVYDPEEGDLQAYTLRPCTESVRAQPVLAGYVMILLND